MTPPLFEEDSLGAKLAEAWNALGSADDALIEDREAFEDAQGSVRAGDPQAVYAHVDDDWVPVFGPTKVSGIADVAGFNAGLITMPLASEGIACAWDPYPPSEMPGPAYPAQHGLDRTFTLFVPSASAEQARGLITAHEGSRFHGGIVAWCDREPEAAGRRKILIWGLIFVFFGQTFLSIPLAAAYLVYDFLRYR